MRKVYVQIPPGLSDKYPSKCFLLKKAIYGLKQAPRVWWLNLSSHSHLARLHPFIC